MAEQVFVSLRSIDVPDLRGIIPVHMEYVTKESNYIFTFLISMIKGIMDQHLGIESGYIVTNLIMFACLDMWCNNLHVPSKLHTALLLTLNNIFKIVILLSTNLPFLQSFLIKSSQFD